MALWATVVLLPPAQAQTVTIEKISGEDSFDSAERAKSKFRIRARGSDAPWRGQNEYAGITVGVKFDYEGRDLEYWSNSNYTRAPGKKVSSFEVVLARSWQAGGSVPGNRFWDVTGSDMGNHDLHLIGPVIVRLYDPPGGRTYSLGSDTAICLVINESDGTAGEPCSSQANFVRSNVELPARLTASFDGLPASHDGQTAFSFRIQFSEDIDATVDGMRDHALTVSGGTVTGAARVNKRDDLWSFTITPSGDGKVEITLAGGASCTADGAICTSDGRQLSTGLLTFVSGPMPTLSVADVQAYEGVDDHMTFYVSMDRAATERSWVKYATADGTAEAGSDYTAKSGELHFFPGEKVRWMIQVPIIDDTVEDDGETFTLTLSDPKGVTIGDGVAIGTIRNSEEPVEVTVADAEATEGEDRWMRFQLSLNHIAKDVSVDYATADDTATAGVDYVASSGSMVLRQGTINTYITVPILSDSVEDDGERFTLTLSNVSGAEIADGEAVGTIRDGDSAGTIQDGEPEPASTGPLWSADMSVVDFGNGSIGAWGADKFSNVGGSGDLEAKWLWYHTGDRKLHLAFTTAIADTTGLSLYIGDAAVAFPDVGNDSSFSWTDVDIAWADGETVPVRIAKGGPVVTPPANAAPTGLPAISETARVREILTALVDDFADADGLENAVYTYQWIANDGTADADIAGATGATYTPVDGDAGKTLKVRVTFTDDKGTEETLTSVATAAVAATVPSAPVGLAVATGEGRERELTVSWTAPESNGGSEVTRYRVQWKSGTEAWDGSETSTRQAVLGDPAAASHTIAELANGTAYTVRVVATNAAGDGEAAEVTATAQDRLAPVLTAASVNGTALTLTFSEALDAVSKAAADAFAVSVEGTARTVDAVALSGSAATLTLASGVASGGTVTMGYTVPTGDDAAPLQDAAGNAVAGYSGHAVTNETPAAANTAPTGLPAITGTAQVGETLTASVTEIADADGLASPDFAYQWVSNDGSSDSDIGGATNASYTLVAADADKTIKVWVTFTDDGGTQETLVSAATDAVTVPLTASFEDVPDEHDGSSTFTFRVRFSVEPRVSYKVLRDKSFAVTGGVVRKARRVDGRNDLREIHIEPSGWGDVTVTLPGGRACGTTGAICTADGKRLLNTEMATVQGPPALNVADARTEEGADATLDFVVTLSRAASGAVTVDYATADGSATAGADYTTASGTLTFDPGTTEQRVSVPVLDDAVDDGGETLTLTLSSASGAWIEDGTATGTIENSDPMPQAWLARFGRTVASQAVEALEERMAQPQGVTRFNPGGGVSRFYGEAPAQSKGEIFIEEESEKNWGSEDTAHNPVEISPGVVLLGSSFHLAVADSDEQGRAVPGPWAIWGRGATTRFEGTDGDLSIDGNVSTGMLGADYRWGRMMFGTAVSRSVSDGDFTLRGELGGNVESSLTAAYPYLRVAATEQISLWGMLGYGKGSISLEDMGSADIKTDISMKMGAFGARGDILSGEKGLSLAVRSEALWVRVESDSVAGLVSVEADASRIRAVVEGGFALPVGSGVFTPLVEAGLRHDGGDAETGFGVEVGGGLRYSNSALGLDMEFTARRLVAHGDEDYGEWGLGGSAHFNPRSSRKGLQMSLHTSSSLGDTQSGVERLWSQREAVTVSGLGQSAFAGSLDAEVGYGVDAFSGRGVLVPYTGFGISRDGDRGYKVGGRIDLGPSFSFVVEGDRRETYGTPAVHGVTLKGSRRW